MKKCFLLFGLFLLAAATFAQAPQAFKYQAVARNSSGEPLENQEISVLISILAGDPSGTVVYSERHLTTTNSLGLFDLEIGNPDEVVSGVFSEINWGTGSFFLKLELDETGGSNYQLMGVSQLLSVPYSLNSLSLTLKSPNGTTYELTVDDEGNLIANCIPEPTQATAGVDQLDLQTTSTSLQGNTPVYGNGIWSIISGIGGNIPEPGNPVSQFYGIAGKSYELEWKISNSCGSAFDLVIISFNENAVWQCGSPITDSRDEKMYNTVQIGDQCWMKENMNVGIRINGNIAQGDNGTIEKYCFSDIDANCEIYGGLYQWKEMMNYSTNQGVQGICLEGWHVPSDSEWCTLTTYLDATVDCAGVGWSGTDAGGKMKETGTTHWASPNIGATNSSWFTALPCGGRDAFGLFFHFSINGPLWSSTQRDYGSSWFWSLDNDKASVARVFNNKSYGFSVRCLKDEAPLNQVPEVPSLPSPSNGAGNQSIDIELSWTCTDPDGDPLTFDVFFGTDANPPQAATSLATTTFDPGTLSFDTQYFWKIIAKDDFGNISEGPVWSFTTEPQPWQCGDPLTDTRDGKTYYTVAIGTQCWMKQNLNVGTKINGTGNQTNNGAIEKYCYNDLESYCDVYGGLYQWNEMMGYTTTAGVQGICPDGWHLPTDGEWLTLKSFVSSQPEWLCNSNTDYISKALASTTNWNTSTQICAIGNNLDINNASGFSALPGGARYHINGDFINISSSGFWWTSTGITTTDVWIWKLFHYNTSLMSQGLEKSYGFSVRCLKDN